MKNGRISRIAIYDEGLSYGVMVTVVSMTNNCLCIPAGYWITVSTVFYITDHEERIKTVVLFNFVYLRQPFFRFSVIRIRYPVVLVVLVVYHTMMPMIAEGLNISFRLVPMHVCLASEDFEVCKVWNLPVEHLIRCLVP
jgi:hypothetical protein